MWNGRNGGEKRKDLVGPSGDGSGCVLIERRFARQKLERGEGLSRCGNELRSAWEILGNV